MNNKIVFSKKFQSRLLLTPAMILTTGLCLSPVLQAQTNDSNATATASADNISSQSNAESGVGTASAQGGVAAGGNSTVVTEITQNFEANKAPGQPTSVVPLATGPALFRPPEGTLPGTAASIVASIAYISNCGISLGGTPTKEVQERGSSGNTEITFLPHRNYNERQNSPNPSMVKKAEVAKAADKDKKNKDKKTEKKKEEKYSPPSVSLVGVKFPMEPVKGECLGMLSVQSREKNSDKAYFFTLLNDAMEFAKNDLRGSPSIDLLCGYRTIATSVGVANGGVAGNISPGLSNLTSNFLYQGLIGGITGSKGRTFPHTQLGITCIVSGQGTDTIDVSMLNRGGTRYDPQAIAAAIDRSETAATQNMNGNHVKEKAAVEYQQSLQPALQKSQSAE